ncbi:MAG: AhpC/TSA family protein [Sphingobacteriales bacterium]|nr:AhpC/TSA family protein [Sphingobacteriales bacterium]
MKKIVFLLFFAPLALLAQTSKGFTIKGKLEGFPEGTSLRLVKNGENTELASGKLLNSAFQLKGKVTEPTLCFLFIGNEQKPVEVYVENKVLTVTVDKTKPGGYKIEGSASHTDFAAFVKEFIPLAQQLSSLGQVINNTLPGPGRDSLMFTYKNMQAVVQQAIDKLVEEKPASFVTAFILSATYAFNEDPLQLEQRFNKLGGAVKASETGRQLAAQIAESKVGAIGSTAIDFTQTDTAGVPVSLSSFRGKYVLIDFWASWCGPCRQENPNVLENFNKFSSKNFTVLGVSLDRPGQKDKWLEAIHHDQLAWTHVSDLQFWNNAAAVKYNVRGIPQNFLIDPDGKIIAKNLRGPALEKKLCEILGCN